MNAEKAEILVRWYLRFNGYFTVENFIVHNPAIVSKDHISNMTETDVLGLRNCFSHEIAGQLHIANDPVLIGTHNTRIDFVVGEVKTGKEDKPNKIWRDKNINAISYLLRFAGFIETESELDTVARVLSNDGVYIHPGNQYSVRLVLFSENGFKLDERKASILSATLKDKLAILQTELQSIFPTRTIQRIS